MSAVIPPIVIKGIKSFPPFAPFQIGHLSFKSKTPCQCYSCNETIEVGEQFVDLVNRAPADWMPVDRGRFCLACVDFETFDSET